MAQKILNMRCNHCIEPIGVDDLPHFSYQIEASDPTISQTALRITVADASCTVWDSGFMESDAQILLPYAGEALSPCTRYSWQVTVRTSDGNETTSPIAYFETGRMQSFGWKAKWITNSSSAIFIGNHCGRRKEYPAPYFRRVFEIQKEVRDATLYISGLGYYECFVNGASLKDTYLDPAFTEYDKAVLYKAHKVANLKPGKNVLGVVLGDGLFNADTFDLWNFVNATWRSLPMCLLILRIEYTDGTVEEIPSDARFVATTGPILRNDLRTTEVYDAGLALGDWTMPDFDDSAWTPAKITKAPGGALSGFYTTPIRKVAEFAPASIQKLSKERWLVDAGFNTVGWASIRLTASKGTEIILRYLEQCDENCQEKQKIATCIEPHEVPTFQVDRYIARGEGVEEWHPIFKYNGYRYIVVECESGIPEDLTLTIEEVRTDLATAGEFTCSDERLNRLQELSLRATLCNFHHMPTDCPHREKNGWTGDAQLSSEQLLLNFDGAAAYSRWMEDVVRAQRPTGQLPGIIPSTGWGFNWGSGPAWDSVAAVIPYTMYLYCGDTRVLKTIYPTVKRYLDFCDTMATDNILAFGLADWCFPRDEKHKTCKNNITDTGYFYLNASIAAKMASILGKEEEALHYATKAKEIRDSFRHYFLKKENGKLMLNHAEPSQAAYAAILAFGMAEKEEKQELLDALKNEIHEQDDHLDVGILALKYVCDVLSEAGEIDLLLKGLKQPTYPSLGFMLDSGATTLWESYEGLDSQNHHMFGVFSATLYKAIAGLGVDERAPAFRNTLFSPQFPSGMTFAKAWHDSPYGRVASHWEREGDSVTLTLTVPQGCTGHLTLPRGFVLTDGRREASFVGGVHTLTAVATK